MSSFRVKVLDAIRAGHGDASRKEIARETGLAWGTMFKTVASLVQDGSVFERAPVRSVQGRPSIPLCVNPDAAHWCGVDVGSCGTRFVLCDLNFRILHQTETTTPRYHGADAFRRWLVKFLESALAAAHTERSRVKALGLAISGNIDHERGIIVSGGNWGVKWGENIDLAPVGAALGLPLYAVTTQNAAACAEFHFGEFAGCPSLVTIGLGAGIGSGVVANGQLLLSEPGRPVGYIGHILIPGNTQKCTCGFTGCLEAFSGGNFLREVARQRLPSRTELHDAAALDRAAANGDQDAVSILDTAASYNAAGIAAMVQLYAPEAIVFSGGQVRPDGFLYHHTLRHLEEILPEERRQFPIRISILGTRQSALGAARLAYEQFI